MVVPLSYCRRTVAELSPNCRCKVVSPWPAVAGLVHSRPSQATRSAHQAVLSVRLVPVEWTPMSLHPTPPPPPPRDGSLGLCAWGVYRAPPRRPLPSPSPQPAEWPSRLDPNRHVPTRPDPTFTEPTWPDATVRRSVPIVARTNPMTPCSAIVRTSVFWARPAAVYFWVYWEEIGQSANTVFLWRWGVGMVWWRRDHRVYTLRPRQKQSGFSRTAPGAARPRSALDGILSSGGGERVHCSVDMAAVLKQSGSMEIEPAGLLAEKGAQQSTLGQRKTMILRALPNKVRYVLTAKLFRKDLYTKGVNWFTILFGLLHSFQLVGNYFDSGKSNDILLGTPHNYECTLRALRIALRNVGRYAAI